MSDLWSATAPTLVAPAHDRRNAAEWNNHVSNTQNLLNAALGNALPTTLTRGRGFAPAPVSVKDYGAQGDGATDDTVAINKALANTPSGGVTLFPPGTYQISAYLHVTVSNTQILGYGAKIVQSGAGQQGFLVDTATGVTIEGPWLYNSLPNGGWTGSPVNINGVRFYNGSDDGKVINCRIENWGESSVYLDGSNRTTVQGCKLIGVGAAGGLVSGSDNNFGIYSPSNGLKGLKLLNNEIYNQAFGIFLGNDFQDVLILGNEIHDIQGQHGIYVDGGKGLRIIGNTVRSPAVNGIKVQTTSGSAADTIGLVIQGNTVDSPGGSGILVIPAAAGLPHRFKSPIVTGNTVRSCGQDGIIIDQADSFKLDHNIVDTTTGYGIRTQTGAPANHTNGHGTVRGNNVSNTQQDGLHLQQADNTKYVMVEDNLLVDTALAGAGFDPISLLDGTWLCRRNTILQTSAPTYDNNVLASAQAVYEISQLVAPGSKGLSLGGSFLSTSFGTIKALMENGSANSRGVHKMWDATAAAWKYAYIDAGAWVIAGSEPT